MTSRWILFGLCIAMCLVGCLADKADTPRPDRLLQPRACYTECQPIIAEFIWCDSDYSEVDPDDIPGDCDEESIWEETIGNLCYVLCSAGGTGQSGSGGQGGTGGTGGNNNNGGGSSQGPCVGNPLAGTLDLAPQHISGRLGATFGCVRHGQGCSPPAPYFSKHHNGVDLLASVGTDLHAQYDGQVLGSGKTQSGGNYLVVKYPSANGRHIKVQYWHLDVTPTITGTFNQGDVIGQTGASGDTAKAGTAPPHVHVIVQEWDPGTNSYGPKIDPTPFLGTPFYSSTLTFGPNPC